MAVLITLATIRYLFRSGGSKVSFLDPELLRAQCEDKLREADGRERALALTDELEELASQYNEAAAAGLDAYIVSSAKWESSANGLIELLKPLDHTRARALQGILRVRQSMLETLTVSEWDRVFG